MQQKELSKCIAVLIRKGITKQFLDMYKANKVKSVHKFILRDYQDLLRTIPKWGKNELLTNCMHLTDVVDELKQLLKQLCTKSTNEMDILHECFIEIARELFKNPMLVYDENYDALETTVYNSIKKVIAFFCSKETTPKEKEVEIPYVKEELQPHVVTDRIDVAEVKEEPLLVVEPIKEKQELAEVAIHTETKANPTKKYIVCKMLLRNRYKSKIMSSIIRKHCKH